MQVNSEIFRAYDIRGIVDKTLTADVVYKIGQALGTKALALSQANIVIGRDGRLSGVTLSQQLAAGILSTGCNVIDIGLVPTPVLYFATKYLQVASAVMLTGSHNPSNYNGLKIILNDTTLYGADIQELYNLILSEKFAIGNGHYQTADVLAAYIDEVAQTVVVPRALKVVVDCGNGVPGIVVPQLLQRLGCEVIPLYCEVDGTFPNHHPDPSDPHNLLTLQETVRSKNADLGLAFDGDGDRIGILDNNGKIIWPDRVLMLFAEEILSQHPGATIIYDVKCSRAVQEIIKQAGGVPLMWNTGHSLIKAKMRETGALLAAEMSGHMFFKDGWYGFDDAIYTAARLVASISKADVSSSQVFAQYPELVSTPELNVTVTEQSKFVIMQDLIQHAAFNEPAQIISIDGMRVEFADGWGLVRPSNTTPKLVIRFEAVTQTALENIISQFRNLFKLVAPQLALPF